MEVGITADQTIDTYHNCIASYTQAITTLSNESSKFFHTDWYISLISFPDNLLYPDIDVVKNRKNTFDDSYHVRIQRRGTWDSHLH